MGPVPRKQGRVPRDARPIRCGSCTPLANDDTLHRERRDANSLRSPIADAGCPFPHLPGAPITRGREQSQDGVDSQNVSSVSAPLQQAAPLGHVSQKVDPGDDTLDSKDGQSLHQFTDARWARIEPLLPSSDGHQGRAFRDNRLVAGGVIYRYRTATAWRDLPDYFSAW